MVDLSLVISIVGVILALVGIAFSYIKTKKLESRLEKKEHARKYAKKLSNIIHILEWQYIKPLKTPLFNEDIFNSLDYFGMEILSRSFENRTSTVSVEIEVSIWSFDLEKNKHTHININSTDEYSIYIKEVENPRLDICGRTGKMVKFDHTSNGIISGVLSHDLFGSDISLSDISSPAEEFRDLINEFSPNLLNEIDRTVKQILFSIVDYSTQHKVIEIDTNKFNNATDISMYIYTKVVATDEVRHNVDVLEKLVDKLDKVRSDLLTTAYA